MVYNRPNHGSMDIVVWLIEEMNMRRFGLFEKNGRNWKRIDTSEAGLHKEMAVRVWQDALLAHVLEGTPERMLRSLPTEVRRCMP